MQNNPEQSPAKAAATSGQSKTDEIRPLYARQSPTAEQMQRKFQRNTEGTADRTSETAHREPGDGTQINETQLKEDLQSRIFDLVELPKERTNDESGTITPGRMEEVEDILATAQTGLTQVGYLEVVHTLCRFVSHLAGPEGKDFELVEAGFARYGAILKDVKTQKDSEGTEKTANTLRMHAAETLITHIGGIWKAGTRWRARLLTILPDTLEIIRRIAGDGVNGREVVMERMPILMERFSTLHKQVSMESWSQRLMDFVHRDVFRELGFQLEQEFLSPKDARRIDKIMECFDENIAPVDYPHPSGHAKGMELNFALNEIYSQIGAIENPVVKKAVQSTVAKFLQMMSDDRHGHATVVDDIGTFFGTLFVNDAEKLEFIKTTTTTISGRQPSMDDRFADRIANIPTDGERYIMEKVISVIQNNRLKEYANHLLKDPQWHPAPEEAVYFM